MSELPSHQATVTATSRCHVNGIPVRFIKHVPHTPGAKLQVIVECLNKGYIPKFGGVEPGCRIVIPVHWLKARP